MTKVFLALFLCVSSLFGGDFYGIIIADTDVENIGDYVYYDYLRMNRQMSKIARHLDRDFKEIMFIDDDVNDEEILTQIEALTLNEDDIVFFYFSGHGQRSVQSQDDPWPLMKLGGRQAMNLSVMTAKLLEKNPRLVISVADCCNNHLTVTPDELFFAQAKGESQGNSEKELVRENTRKLFLNHRGLIMVSSSQPGEPAWSGLMGSYYTLYLTQALYYELREDTTSWEIIFERVTERLEDGQHPQYLIIPSNEEAQYFNKLMMN